jgi:hypothetical protein
MSSDECKMLSRLRPTEADLMGISRWRRRLTVHTLIAYSCHNTGGCDGTFRNAHLTD